MIRFRNVSQYYDHNQRALNRVNFSIDTGEFVFITGHSGAGKSTLLKLIARLETSSHGSVTVDKVDLKNLNSWQIPLYRRQLGVILQDSLLLPEKNCFDNVALPLKIMHTSNDVQQKRVRAALDRVGLLRKVEYYPHMLSTGEQQRLCIARAIVHRPKIIIADEPTGNLDPVLSMEILSLFERFHQVGVTIIIATHDTSLLQAFGHRQLILNHGELIHDEKVLATKQAI